MNSPSDSNMAELRHTIEISKDTVPSAFHEQTNFDAFQIPEDAFQPTPIMSRLLAAGVPQSVAEEISNASLNQAFQLKEMAKESIMKTCAMLRSLPGHDQTQSISSLRQHVIQVHQANFRELLLEWESKVESLAQAHIRSSIADEVQTSPPQMKRRFKSEFLPLFEFAFSKERFPSREDKKHLARISGMSYRQVSVWFQNRRCRSGKRTSASPEPQTFDEVKERLFESASFVAVDYQRNNEEQDGAQLSRKRIKCDSPAIIDLTVEEKRTIEDSSPFSEEVHNDMTTYEEKLGSKQISSNNTPCMSSDISMNSDSSLFLTPYIPSVPNSDPFTLKMDASLWQRRRGPKRPRASERDVRIEDIISEMGSLGVLSSSCDKFNTRPVKPLPRRSQASVLPITTSSLSIPRRSFSFSSESSTDELAFSPLSRTSSTVASSLQSPESFEVNLPTLISDTSSSEYSEGESLQEDRCLHEGFASDNSYSFNSLSLRVDKEVEESSCAERCSIGLDFGLSDLPTFQPESPEINVSSWNGLLAA